MNQPYDPRDVRQRQARRAALRKKRQQRRRLQLIGLGVLAVVVIVLLAVLLSQCTKEEVPAAETTTQSQETTEPKAAITWQPIPTDRILTAKQYFVYDSNAEAFLSISESPQTRIYPASITKLVTAAVALQYLSPSDKVTAGEALNMVAAGSSVAELEKGDTLTVEQLIGGMILPSGNDAANVLAVEAGRKILNQPTADAASAINAFVKKMNEEATALGMTDTHFANPDGIHKEDHYTTYQDIVLMAKLAQANPAVMMYCGVAAFTEHTEAGRSLQWHNTNLLVDPESQYYCPYAIGLKTGQTPYAGSCLLSAFNVNNTGLIIGVFGCPDVESRFADTLQLLQMYMDGGE